MSDLLRISGLASGIDTDNIIKQLVSLEKLKVDQAKQKMQYAEWQRDAYRDIIKKVMDFKNEYFDYLKPVTNMRSSLSFSSNIVLFGGAETSEYLSMSVNTNSTLLNKSITGITVATTAKAEGVSLAKPMAGSDITGFEISQTNDNLTFTVTLNDLQKVITLDPISDTTSDVTDLASQIQQKLNTAFGSDKIQVGTDGTKLTFSSAATNTLRVDYASNQGLSTLFAKLDNPITLTELNNKFKLTDNSTNTTKTIELNTGVGLTLDNLVADMQNKIDNEFGDGSPDSSNIRVLTQNNTIVLKAIASTGSAVGNLANEVIGDTTAITEGVNDTLSVTIDGVEKSITLTSGTYTKSGLLSQIQSKLDGVFNLGGTVVSLDDSGKLRFEEVDSTRVLTKSVQETNGLSAIGFDGVIKSNKVDLDANLSDILDIFNTVLQPNDTVGEVPENSYDIEFTINGERFAFDSTTTSLKEIMAEVNTREAANVTMKYSELTDNFMIESKDTGILAAVEIADVPGEGNLMAVLGLDGVDVNGTDAQVTFNGGEPDEVTIARSENAFTFDGVTFDLKKDLTSGSIDLSLTTDTSKVTELIKGFVEKYNDLVTTIHGRLREERDRDYVPLTEDKKTEMSDREIELWEEKAKEGMLRNEPLLENMLNEIREALYTKVEGVGISLYDIGITTSASYLDGGKLVLDETKLNKALKDNPQDVTSLFTQTSTVDGEKGISQRIFDIMNKNIRTTRDAAGYKGLLIEKAGILGDTSDVKNYFSKQISDYDDLIDNLSERLLKKEDSYYRMFARMEQAISQMNAQSAWLSSQLGGGTQ